MANFPPPLIPAILKQTTELKIDELERQTEAFRDRYLRNLDKGNDVLTRTTKLLEQIKTLDPDLEDDDDLEILERLVGQAKRDPTVSTLQLQKYEKRLLRKLNLELRRLEVSSFHAKLVEDAMKAGASLESVAAKLENASSDDEFELVGQLEAAFDLFEKNAFSTRDVDEKLLEQYLANLFDTEDGKIALQNLREDVGDFGSSVPDDTSDEVSDDTIAWCIKDLLDVGLLCDEKKRTLQGYLQSPAALRELRSTLQMRSIRHWNWRNASKGLPITPRQGIDGTYHIVVEEDLMDMLFLHIIAVNWSTKLKEFLQNLISDTRIWSRGTVLSQDELDKQEYYLLAPRPEQKPATQTTICTMCHIPPPPPPPMEMVHPPLPPSVVNVAPHLPHPMPVSNTIPPPPPIPVTPSPVPPMVMNSIRSPPSMPSIPPPPMPSIPPPPPMPAVSVIPPPPCMDTTPPPPPPLPTWGFRSKKIKRRPHRYMGRGLNDERYRNYTNNFFLARLPGWEDDAPKLTPAHETHAALIKHLAVELKIRHALDGEVHTIGNTFESFPLSLPHKTILTVLKFIGVSEMWLDMFSRFLKAPLNIGPEGLDAEDQVLTRTCGVPLGHGLERLFGELVLFILELAVHQKTNGYLYRIEQAGYFVGSKTQCDLAKATMSEFAKAAGLDLVLRSDGIGLMSFDSKGTTTKLSIDIRKVEKKALWIKEQLSTRTAVLDWVRFWNATVGTYASHWFGPLANVFGKDYIEEVTKALNRMHEVIFGDSNLTEHVTKMLRPHLLQFMRYPTYNLEPLIYLPTAYGGLGVQNPYISLDLSRNMCDNPDEKMQTYVETEKIHYTRFKESFEGLEPEVREKKLNSIFEKDEARIARVFGSQDTAQFISFEDFVAYRESIPYLSIPGRSSFYHPGLLLNSVPSLLGVYNSLIFEPTDDIDYALNIWNAVNDCGGRNGMKSWRKLSGEEKWVMIMYGEEVIEEYGSLEMWKSECVPKEVLMLIKGEENTFDDDDDDTCSDYSEV